LYAAGRQFTVAGTASGQQAEAAPMVFPLFLLLQAGGCCLAVMA